MSNDNPGFKVLNGGRADLEQELLEALFAPDADSRVQALKTRLTRRGRLTAIQPDEPSSDGA